MRALFLIFAVSVASQLPARDVPPSRKIAALKIVHARQDVCREEAKQARPFVASGPTVYALPGSIA